MANSYATPTEIKAALPDAMRASTTKYDAVLARLAAEVSRYVDNHCHRPFYPALATRYFYGRAQTWLRVPDLLSIVSVSVSDDGGLTYTALAGTDYFGSVEGDVNSPKSYTHLHGDLNGDYSTWPTGQKSVKVVGVWGYTDDRATCWEDSLDTVENNPLASGGTSVTVNDDDGPDLWGVIPRFASGQLARIESEYVEITAAGANSLTVARGRNGTTAAAHAQNVGIDLWRPPEPVKQAVIIQLARGFERAQQGFGDARANPELSQTIWTRALDPDVVSKLAQYVSEPVHA